MLSLAIRCPNLQISGPRVPIHSNSELSFFILRAVNFGNGLVLFVSSLSHPASERCFTCYFSSFFPKTRKTVQRISYKIQINYLFESEMPGFLYLYFLNFLFRQLCLRNSAVSFIFHFVINVYCLNVTFIFCSN